jgi:hypothetical protein
LLACVPCNPGDARCAGQTAERCAPDGQTWIEAETCDTTKGVACRQGACVQLCEAAVASKSNVGCEYFAVDLDNANVSAANNAAAQQFAVVVSNPQPDVAADVLIEVDDAPPGSPSALRTVSKATVAPRALEVFKLGPREVDGSAEGTFDTGSHTALTRAAFRVRSSFPIVAYQFNPLENVNVFSNDASQLLPVGALSGGYVIAGWPQTIATSSNPQVNFGQDLRAFLTIVGTRPNTLVTLRTHARVVPGGPLGAGLSPGEKVDVVLQPFEVLNLETGDFGADFTGSEIVASAPVVVYTGSEASDAPTFSALSERSCCADHLEEQNVPLRSVGRRYVSARVPNRSRAVAAAGGNVPLFPEPELVRLVATQPGKTRITTSLPAPFDRFELEGVGASQTLRVTGDFVLEASQATMMVTVQASQEAAGVPRGLPGGDPSLAFVPPVEQWRADYVLLTPDKYAFDFLVIAAPAEAQVFLDGLRLGKETCEVAPGDGLTEAMRGRAPEFLVYRCQLSFPVIDPSLPAPGNVRPGKQGDGVHRVQSDLPVGVLVYGFDSFVSYAYAGGTDLREVNVR